MKWKSGKILCAEEILWTSQLCGWKRNKKVKNEEVEKMRKKRKKGEEKQRERVNSLGNI